MTTEEALQELKESIVGQGFQCHPETYQMAIAALEKQIAKRPKSSAITNDIRIVGYCPNCDSFIDKYMPCCNNCGQKLDWSEE